MTSRQDNPIFVPDYWPFFRSGERRIFSYVCHDGSEQALRSIFSYDPSTDSMLYENYDASGAWLNTWYYQYRHGFGVAEWRDDHPLCGWRQRLFGPRDRHVFRTPIGWGESINIGESYTNHPMKSLLHCWPPMFSIGRQDVKFEKLLPEFQTHHGVRYRDVLVFRYTQRLGGFLGGARYYSARGIGPVAIEWIGFHKSGTEYVRERIDATVEYE